MPRLRIATYWILGNHPPLVISTHQSFVQTYEATLRPGAYVMAHMSHGRNLRCCQGQVFRKFEYRMHWPLPANFGWPGSSNLSRHRTSPYRAYEASPTQSEAPFETPSITEVVRIS